MMSGRSRGPVAGPRGRAVAVRNGVFRGWSRGWLAGGCAAVALAVAVSACAGPDGAGVSQSPVPGPDSATTDPDGPDRATPLTPEQMRQMYESMSRPAKKGKPIQLGGPETIPERAPAGGIIVSAYIGQGPSSRIEVRELAEGAPAADVKAAIAELWSIPGATTVDWSLPPEPNSTTPNDPRWNPNPREPNLAAPFTRVGLCCSAGLADGWGIAERMYRSLPVAQQRDVNIAILDSGLVSVDQTGGPGTIADDLEARFIGGWDSSNTRGAPGPATAGKDWGTYEKSGDVDDHHGTDVAGYALAQAGNAKGAAGAAGNLPNVKFGMFRVFDYKVQTNSPIAGQETGAMSLIRDQVAASQQNPAGAGALRWNIVNMSLGGPKGDATTSRIVDDLAHRGVLVIISASNERNKYDTDTGGYYDDRKKPPIPFGKALFGRNPIEFPGAYPSGTAVAAWGPRPVYKGKDPTTGKYLFDYSGLYGDATADYSSMGPHVDIAAPGSALPGTAKGGDQANFAGNGTSYASPMLAGIAASLISATGDKFQCIDKPTEAARFACVGDLRAALLGATGDIAGAEELPISQGAGIIDVPRALLGRATIVVPSPPGSPALGAGPKLTVTAVDAAKSEFTFDLSGGVAEPGNAQMVTDAGGRLQYQLYVDGDPTRKVETAELDPSLGPDTAYPTRVGNRWIVPGLWTKFRIPLPRSDDPALNAVGRVMSYAGVGPTVRVSVTAVATYKGKKGKDRRQAESLPIAFDCPTAAAGGAPAPTTSFDCLPAAYN